VIVLGEWQAAVEALAARPYAGADGVTTAQIADELRCSVSVARQRMSALVRAGQWEFAGNMRAIRMDGRATVVPTYRPVATTTAVRGKKRGQIAG
jgi:predicted ArsR family transcriptional regulator